MIGEGFLGPPGGVSPPVSPVPLKVAVCGLLLALSVTVRVAVRVPEMAGEKITLIVQLVLAASEVPQLSLSANSPLGTILMPLIERAVGPLLVNVRV